MHLHSTKVAKTEKVDRETPSGSEYPRRMRCAKLHLMLPAHQAGEAKRTRKRRKYGGDADRGRRKYEMNARTTKTGEQKKRTMMRNRDSRRGNVATLLIENSSALAILIKSRKSLARSIGQTGKARSVGSPFGNGRARSAHTLRYFRLSLRALFRLFEILEPTVAEETQIVILYKWDRNIYL